MGLETFALINDLDQVVNHIVVDKEASNFEEVMAGQLEHWGCVRYVETTEEQPLIILDADPEIWTTHNDEQGFILPDGSYTNQTTGEYIELRTKKASELPEDSLLLEANKANRPEGWEWPEGLTVLEGE
jgi:hypothetical protein